MPTVVVCVWRQVIVTFPLFWQQHLALPTLCDPGGAVSPSTVPPPSLREHVRQVGQSNSFLPLSQDCQAGSVRFDLWIQRCEDVDLGLPETGSQEKRAYVRMNLIQRESEGRRCETELCLHV